MSNGYNDKVNSAWGDSEARKVSWSYQIFARDNKIQAQKLIDIWTRKNSLWTRWFIEPIEMNWQVGYFDKNEMKLEEENTPNNHVYAEGERIIFDKGCLAVVDPGLKGPLLGYEIEFPSTVSENLISEDNKNAPLSRTIHIEIELESSPPEPFHPLLYFPQEDIEKDSQKALGNILLGIGAKDKNRHLYWEISNQCPAISAPFELKGGNNTHSIVISQDGNWFPEDDKQQSIFPVYFELLVNGLGLEADLNIYKELMLTNHCSEILQELEPQQNRLIRSAKLHLDLVRSHLFGTGERTFYIGYAPVDPMVTIWQSKNSEGSFFSGEIRRFVFDPNSSCPECSP